MQQLTRHRLHLAKILTKEKAYMLSNIFLKFSEFSLLYGEQQPFSDRFGKVAASVLTDFLSTEEIVDMPLDALIPHICKKAARDSYRLDKCLYEPLTISIASSFNLISAYTAEIKAVNKAIEKTLKGLDPAAYQCLLSIPGIGSVMAAGILRK